MPHPGDETPGASARAARPRTVPLRSLLVSVVAVPALLASLIISATSYTNTARDIRVLSDANMAAVALQAVDRTRGLLDRAAPALELNRALLRDTPTYGVLRDGPPGKAECRARADLFLRVIGTHPRFMQVYYGDRWRDFTAAYRDPRGTLWTDHRWFANGRFRRVVHPASARPGAAPAPSPGARDFDPTGRSWYRLAVARRRLVWTRPYPFWESGRLGITAALPLEDGSGSVRGVFGIDFDLDELNDFVGTLGRNLGGEAFLVTGDGRVLAEPAARLADARSAPPSELPRAAQSADPVLRGAAARMPLAATGGSTRVAEILSAGRRYLAAYLPFESGSDLPWMIILAIPEEKIDGPARRNSLITLAWCAAALVITAGTGAVLAERLSRPLRALAAKMGEVERFIIPTEPSAASRIAEVNTMTTSFDRMKTSLRSFARYVPADLVRALHREGQEAKLGGQTTRVTLFFADVVGFTAISETMTPAELVDALAEYLEEMDEIIMHHGGVVDKYLGDAVMAIWGAPILPLEDAERRACAAALEYLERFDTLRAEREAKDRPFFEAHVGIHTGEALVGNIGSRDRMNYTAMGDTVNVASHLEDLTRLYATRILISESTYAAVRDEYEARLIDWVAIKGRSRPIEVYELLARQGEVPEALRPVLAAYAKGLRLYRAREWEAAAAQFRRAMESGSAPDGPSRLFLTRCDGYRETPPAPGWDGVFVVTGRQPASS